MDAQTSEPPARASGSPPFLPEPDEPVGAVGRSLICRRWSDQHERASQRPGQLNSIRDSARRAIAARARNVLSFNALVKYDNASQLSKENC